MNKVYVAAALALGLFAAGPASAQVVDMSTIKCEDFLKSSADDIGALLMWISGYYANEDDETTVDFGKMKENGIKIANYCKDNPTIGLLNATEKALGRDN
ncbi:HdeA/HdeB family protein [Rhizobiales bacterium GAS191]|nr:HdeA/HdeB family protein [Rhizobiales bacterium GAS113]SEC21601.1 HdeA/HdeB family protein [Rhizobiales bacterium GAS188]SED02792.1 HdeA/HdeB family protein [Rhizobiales bacterium GAS191]